MAREMRIKRSTLSRYSRLKKQSQMEQKKELAIWALEVTDWATVWVPTVLMVYPMALATMAQEQRGPQNLLDLVMDSDMEVLDMVDMVLDMEVSDMVDLEAMGLAMAMVSMVDTFGRDLLRIPPPNL
jgi:hypothetical protein